MRKGEVVGVPIDGGWMVDISERGGVRWGLFKVCLIGEREIDSGGSGVCLRVGCSGFCGVVWLCEAVVGFLPSWGDASWSVVSIVCQNSSP